MNRLAVLAVSLLCATAFGEPEVKIDCPAGMHFETNKGCVANLAPKVACPGGTHFEGGKCVAIIDTSCPAGMHFVAGTGCVAGASAKAAAPKTDAPPPPPERPEPTGKKKGGSVSRFANRLVSTCGGLAIEVHGGARVTGVTAFLLANGTKIGDELAVNVGETKTLTGKQGGKDIDFKVEQGLWGTRYTVKVDGAECRLTK